MIWLFTFILLVFDFDQIFAQIFLPFDKIEEAVLRYGLMEKLLCEDAVCLVTWNRADIESFDSDICTLKNKKRVLCRYIYDFI